MCFLLHICCTPVVRSPSLAAHAGAVDSGNHHLRPLQYWTKHMKPDTVASKDAPKAFTVLDNAQREEVRKLTREHNLRIQVQ